MSASPGQVNCCSGKGFGDVGTGYLVLVVCVAGIGVVGISGVSVVLLSWSCCAGFQSCSVFVFGRCVVPGSGGPNQNQVQVLPTERLW